MTPCRQNPIAEKLSAVREALRHRRLANGQRHLYSFYVEHSLLEQAEQSRTAMLEHLRAACRHWRTALDLDLGCRSGTDSAVAARSSNRIYGSTAT